MRVRSNKHTSLPRSVRSIPSYRVWIISGYGTGCLDPNPDRSCFVILLLQFRSALCPHVDLGFDRSASAPPFVQVLLGVFVSGSGLHRQIWKYVALVYANYAFSFFIPVAVGYLLIYDLCWGSLCLAMGHSPPLTPTQPYYCW